MNSEELTEKYYKHVTLLQRYMAGRLILSHKLYLWHLSLARGYRNLLANLAVQGDEAAGNVVLGAPHFITFSDEQVQNLES